MEVYMSQIIKKADVFVLAGVNGCGKSYLSRQLQDTFDIVDYDSMSLPKCIEACKTPGIKPKLLVTPIQAKRMMRELRESGVEVRSTYLREPREVIVDRILSRSGEVTATLDKRTKRYESLASKGTFDFTGNQEEVKGWLLTNPYL